jgi:hypothetical protein
MYSLPRESRLGEWLVTATALREWLPLLEYPHERLVDPALSSDAALATCRAVARDLIQSPSKAGPLQYHLGAPSWFSLNIL